MKRIIFGIIILAIGVMMMAKALGYDYFDSILEADWKKFIIPGIVLLIGLRLVFSSSNGHEHSTNMKLCEVPEVEEGEPMKISVAFAGNAYNFRDENFHGAKIDAAIEEAAKRNDELQKATSALEDAIRRRSEFVANMTHQIRTPLNLILGFSQLLRDTSGADLSHQEREQLLQVIDYNAMALTRMSLMLYDSSDRGYHDEMVSFTYEPVSCNEIARECIGYVNRYFPGVTVKFHTQVEDSFTLVSDHLFLMRSIREILERLIRKNPAALQDQLVTMRDGRYCVPVKPEKKGEVPGVVHDTSAARHPAWRHTGTGPGLPQGVPVHHGFPN